MVEPTKYNTIPCDAPRSPGTQSGMSELKKHHPGFNHEKPPSWLFGSDAPNGIMPVLDIDPSKGVGAPKSPKTPKKKVPGTPGKKKKKIMVGSLEGASSGRSLKTPKSAKSKKIKATAATIQAMKDAGISTSSPGGKSPPTSKTSSKSPKSSTTTTKIKQLPLCPSSPLSPENDKKEKKEDDYSHLFESPYKTRYETVDLDDEKTWQSPTARLRAGNKSLGALPTVNLGGDDETPSWLFNSPQEKERGMVSCLLFVVFSSSGSSSSITRLCTSTFLL
jgi:hypothetical protein